MLFILVPINNISTSINIISSYNKLEAIFRRLTLLTCNKRHLRWVARIGYTQQTSRRLHEARYGNEV